ncbi:MAG: phosphatase PAP2 family protein [Lentisphaerae bacterium]|nr:phosphatase PAP2 family protein [Lentisphaerota bacterium]
MGFDWDDWDFDWNDWDFDIDILLGLQQFRNGIGEVFADFLAQMTWLAESKTVLVIMAVIYWGCSKRFGSFLLLGWNANRLVNGFLKITVCAYRPWIRDARIVPYGHSIRTATGYSFPSGHSTNAASVYGGGMLWKSFPGILRILMAVIVILVPFSRLYLGVHTPQDVLCGTAFSLLTMWLVLKLLRWLETHPGKDWIVPGIGIILSIALAAYAGFKPYPADYDAKGKLLVNGMTMARDTFKCVGWCSGFLIAWILERRLVGFSTDIPGVVKATRIAAGMLGYYILNLIFIPLLRNGLGPGTFAVAASFLQMFYIVFFFPFIFSVFEKWQKRRIENSNTVSAGN